MRFIRMSENKLYKSIGILLCIILATSAKGYAQDDEAAALAEMYKSQPLSQPQVEEETSAQSKLNTVVSLQEGQQNLITALETIARQADLELSYSKQFIPLYKKVSIEETEVTAERALWHVLEDTPFRFGISASGQLVLLRMWEKESQPRQETVSGQVTDAQSGETLPGVNVMIKGTTTGTSTDSEGGFELTMESLQDTLVFSFVGYQTQEVPVNGRTELEVSLQSEAISGEELVVVGYGEQKEVNITGSVSQIDSEGIESRAVNSSTQALQGLAPNLNVDVNSTGGASDASMNMNIRGTGSLSSSNPYILIDGVRAQQDELAALDPNAIQDISVLKDAASTAIYGAQAAYGVILVETKKGNKNEDFTFNYSNNFRVKKRIFVPSSVNSLKYAEVLNESSRNFSGQTAIGGEQMDQIRAFMEGEVEYGTAPDPESPNEWLGIQSGTSDGWYSGFANTDWWNVMYNDLGFTQKHNIAASGGSDNISYRVSGSYFNDAGQLAYGEENENYTRYNLNSNINAEITDWLNISNNSSFYQENNVFPATLEGGSRGRLYHDVMRFSPLAPHKTPPVEDEQGNVIVPEQSALLAGWNEKNGFNGYNINNFVSTLKAEVNVTSNLNVEGDFTFKRRFYDRTLNFKKWSLLGPQGTPSITYQTNNNQIRKDIRKTNYLSFNIYSDYNKTFFDKHNLGVLVGYQQEENNYFQVNTARQNVIADELNSMNVAAGNILGPDNPMSTWATLGAFGRLTYNFEEKYLFEFNGRYDGSSRFAENNRFGFYPSMSVGYNIHQENFWDSLSDYVNTLKIRASWGKLGNQDVGSYLHLSSIPVNDRLSWAMDGERPIYTNMPDIVSPDITWETSITKNIGADISFLDNRLSTTIDIYERQTDNMFGPSGALPAVLGADPPETNSASLKTTGWELSVGWQDQINDFSYNMELMLSDNKTIITEYHNPEKVISSYYEGQELGEIWGFEADKLFESQAEVDEYTSQVDLSYFGTDWQPGNVKYKDLNGDGSVDIGDNTVDNPGDRKKIGNSNPRYRVSLQTGLSWKNFDVNMLWQGVGERDYWPDSYGTLFWGWNSRGHSIVTEPTLDYWSEDNPDAYLPITLESGGRSGFGKDRYPSTRYMQDASYIRLKSLNIGYTLPTSFVQKLDIKNVRIYMNGENLLTFTNLWENFDPELVSVTSGNRIGQGRAYPLAQVYGFGIDISF